MEFSDGAIKKFIAKFFGNIPLKYFPTIYGDEAKITFERMISKLPPEELPSPPNDLKENFDKANNLLNRLVGKPKEWGISRIPILLTMLCILWNDDSILPETATGIFSQIVLNIAQHNWVRCGKSAMNSQILEQELDEVLIGLGEVALKGSIQSGPEGKFAFPESDFECTSVTGLLDKATGLGIVLKERRSKCLRVQYHVSFSHKTFQEFCMAKYLVDNLEKSNKKEFTKFISQLTLNNYTNYLYIMQFT